jgi:hypothetical protein
MGQHTADSIGVGKRQAIFVLACHRSGISGIAGVFAKLGAILPGNLRPGDKFNKRNCFESVALAEFNDQLLASAGSRWDDWRQLTRCWHHAPTSAPFKASARELFAAMFGTAPLVVLKDPRNCRLLPFWLDVLGDLGVEPHVVIPVRSPLEVARSLHHRHGFPLPKGLLLWLRHVLEAEAETRNLPRSIFSWDEFLSDWRAVADKISHEAGITWSRLSDRTACEIEEFLTAGLKERGEKGVWANHPEVHEWVLRAYGALMALAEDADSVSGRALLDQIAKEFNNASAAFGRVIMSLELALDSAAARARTLEDTTQALQAARLLHERVLNSTTWRITAPLRTVMDVTPKPLRLLLRRGFKAAYWAVTPWKTWQRLRFLRDRRAKRATDQRIEYAGTGIEANSRIFALVQDRAFPGDLLSAQKIMVFVVPEHNAMSGGIYSIFSIADHMRRVKTFHGHDVLVLTRPQPGRLTYFRNTNFRNSENVYRFEQLCLCKGAREIYLHVPEYASEFLMRDLSREERQYLLSRETVHVNLLNQNIKLMPSKECFADLREFCGGSLSQSVAHHAYFTQEIADKYHLPTLLLPPYTDLSAYSPVSFDQKEKLIIYSLDEAPHKRRCLERIARDLPDFALVEIRDISFDRYMDCATRCMFSISFGEGFDGYLAQPIHQGGIGFTVYEPRFFPSDRFRSYENIFTSGDEMVEGICDRILFLSRNREVYRSLNKKWIEEYSKLYDYDDYLEKIKKLAFKEFELFPRTHRP